MRLHFYWTPLGVENERSIGLVWPGHWAFAIVLPRIIWSGGRRRHA